MSEYSGRTLQQMDSVQKLLELLNRPRQKRSGESFEETERLLHDHMCAVECELLARELSHYDETADEIQVNGTIYRRKQESRMTYQAGCGDVAVERHIYVPRGVDGRRAVCPLEMRAGIVEGAWTPRAARIMTMSVALTTPAEASLLLGEIGGLNPSTSSLDRLPKAMSEKWEPKRVEFEAELRSAEPMPRHAVTMVISLDGVLAPMKDTGRSQIRATEGKQPKGPAGYREVGCGTVSLYDGLGERLETKRFARMPEANKVALKKQLVEEAKSNMSAEPGLTTVFVSDGAPDNWALVEQLKIELGIVDIHEVLDVFHVLERIKKALDTYHGEGSAKSKGSFEELRARLLENHNGVTQVLRALRYRRDRCTGNKRTIIDQQVTYLQNHSHLMQYAFLSEENLPIGSGVVEAACKTLVTQRMKRSGMSWRQKGGQAVLTFRALIQRDRWDHAWALLARQYMPEVTVKKAA